MPSPEAAFHAAETNAVAREVGVSLDRGLSSEEAKRRRERHGDNVLEQGRRRGALRILLAQFRSIVILLLVAAAVLAFATGRLPEGIALVAVTLVNTLIGFVSEWKAVRAMEALREMVKPHVRVRRDGEAREVDAVALVPGDVLLLGPEDLVSADARVVYIENLRVNEAALTGESVPVGKRTHALDEATPLAERENMVYRGTSVTEGEGEAVVVATGMDTELGRISRLAQEAESRSTPLSKQLDRLGRRLAWIVIGIAVVVAGVGLIAGREMVLMIETAIALGVAAIPEGLPIVATIGLARGMYRMARRNAIVNHLPAVETLGATQVIFSDKTGTLTENRMTVQRVVTAAGESALDDDGGPADAREGGDLLERVLQIGVLCSNASLGEDEGDGKGDPTEVALLQAGADHGLDRETLLEETPEEREVSFDPDVMMMATFHRKGEGLRVAVKGAPAAVLDAATRIVTPDGEDVLDDDGRREWRARADALAAEGLRLLAMAEKRVDDAEADPYADLAFAGLVGMFDPPREDVREAVEECQSAGIRAVMVTGDRADTGRAIGERVGLEADGGPEAVHGSELEDPNEVEDEAERTRLLEASVFARVTPEQKLDLIRLYQERGLVVAMTGDGVNDAPALKQADIGIAMGKRGTDAAKQVADMVLRDDRFGTIVAAVREGRIIFANIRKSVMFMLCTNLAEILAVTIASLAQAPIPLRPLQILYLNVITDVLPALALAFGEGTADVMKNPPRDPRESVLTRTHWKAVAGWSALVGACVLAALWIALGVLDYDAPRAITVSFLTLAFAKLWFVLNLRDRGTPVWRNDVTQNPWVGGAVAVCIGLLLLAVYWPPLSHVLETVPPDAAGWALLLGVSLVPAVAGIFVPGIPFHTAKRRSEE